MVDVTNEAAVEVQRLIKRYRGRAVVDEVSFSVSRGEIFAILGPNGAGKTTTVEILEGLRSPDDGRVRVLGLDPDREGGALRPRIGVMLQEGGVPLGLRAGEVLGLFSAMYREPDSPAALLEQVGLTEAARTVVRNLSGGQRQRLSLAMALIGRPELVFLDEPTVGMDAQARNDTWAAIRARAAAGVTVILTTHYLREAEDLADRVAILDEGKLVALDRPDELIDAFAGTGLHLTASRAIDPVALGTAIQSTVTVVEGAMYRVESEPTPELIAAIARWFAEENVLVTELRAGGGSLEETFLRLTGRGLDDD